MLQIGETVLRVPVTFNSVIKPRSYRGKVVYVHPEGRFHVVAFPAAEPLQKSPWEKAAPGVIRESFPGVGKELC